MRIMQTLRTLALARGPNEEGCVALLWLTREPPYTCNGHACISAGANGHSAVRSRPFYAFQPLSFAAERFEQPGAEQPDPAKLTLPATWYKALGYDPASGIGPGCSVSVGGCKLLR